jgi:hypothetical protein
MGAAAAVILRKERDIVNMYRGSGATTPDRARRPEEIGVHQRLAFERLVRRAVLREAGSGAYYLDEQRWQAWRSVRHRVALVMLVIVVTLLAALLATGVVTFGASRVS